MLPTQNTTASSSASSQLSLLRLTFTIVVAWGIYAAGVHFALNAQLANSKLNSIWRPSTAEVVTNRRVAKRPELKIVPAEVGNLPSAEARLSLRIHSLPEESSLQR